MSVFNNIYKKIIHIISIGTESPQSNALHGKIYAKDDGFLYFTNTVGTEYILSNKKT